MYPENYYPEPPVEPNPYYYSPNFYHQHTCPDIPCYSEPAIVPNPYYSHNLYQTTAPALHQPPSDFHFPHSETNQPYQSTYQSPIEHHLNMESSCISIEPPPIDSTESPPSTHANVVFDEMPERIVENFGEHLGYEKAEVLHEGEDDFEQTIGEIHSSAITVSYPNTFQFRTPHLSYEPPPIPSFPSPTPPTQGRMPLELFTIVTGNRNLNENFVEIAEIPCAHNLFDISPKQTEFSHNKPFTDISSQAPYSRHFSMTISPPRPPSQPPDVPQVYDNRLAPSPNITLYSSPPLPGLCVLFGHTFVHHHLYEYVDKVLAHGEGKTSDLHSITIIQKMPMRDSSINLDDDEVYLHTIDRSGNFGRKGDIETAEYVMCTPGLFVEYLVWLREIKSLSHFQEMYILDVYHVDNIAGVLYDQYQGWEKSLLLLLHRINYRCNFSKPDKFESKGKFDWDRSTVHPIVTECLVVKSDLELVLIQFSNYLSSEANVEITRKTGVGIKEHQLEIKSHHNYMYGGCSHCSDMSSCAIVVINSLVKIVLMEQVFQIVLFVSEEVSYGLLITLASESGGWNKAFELYEDRPCGIICRMESDKTAANGLFYGNFKSMMQLQSSSWSLPVSTRTSGFTNLATDGECSMEVTLAECINAWVMIVQSCKSEKGQEQAARALTNINVVVGRGANAIEALMQLIRSPSWSWWLILKASFFKGLQEGLHLGCKHGSLKVPSLRTSLFGGGWNVEIRNKNNLILDKENRQ